MENRKIPFLHPGKKWEVLFYCDINVEVKNPFDLNTYVPSPFIST